MPKKDEKQNGALRKRQQISQANKMMFIWVAGASAIVGAAGVIIWSLSQQLIYNEQVLAAKQDTIGNLKHNNSIVEELKKNVRIRNTDQKLANLKTETETEPAQVVFDALPATANSAALGSSLLTDKILTQPGVKIDSVSVEPLSSEGDTSSDTGATSSASTGGEDAANTIEFSFSVTVEDGDANKLKDILSRLERSIRTFTLTNVNIEKQGDTKLQMTVKGVAYYQPGMSVEMGSKVIPLSNKAATNKKASKK